MILLPYMFDDLGLSHNKEVNTALWFVFSLLASVLAYFYWFICKVTGLFYCSICCCDIQWIFYLASQISIWLWFGLHFSSVKHYLFIYYIPLYFKYLKIFIILSSIIFSWKAPVKFSFSSIYKTIVKTCHFSLSRWLLYLMFYAVLLYYIQIIYTILFKPKPFALLSSNILDTYSEMCTGPKIKSSVRTTIIRRRNSLMY